MTVSARAKTVGSGDSAWGGRSSPRRVSEVIGPMEMRSERSGRVTEAASQSARRVRAVLELVKVMASG